MAFLAGMEVNARHRGRDEGVERSVGPVHGGESRSGWRRGDGEDVGVVEPEGGAEGNVAVGVDQGGDERRRAGHGEMDVFEAKPVYDTHT